MTKTELSTVLNKVKSLQKGVEALLVRVNAELAKPVDAAETIDRGQAENEHNLNRAIKNRLCRQLKELSAAEQRILKGELGSCGDCGVEITLEQYMILPTIVKCVECRGIDEMKKAQNG